MRSNTRTKLGHNLDTHIETMETKAPGLGLERIDRSRWNTLLGNSDRLDCFKSAKFTVATFSIPGNIVRLSVHLNAISGSNKLYVDGITWDDLQTIKNECGYADRMAVEIYPEAAHVLNIINARHLWILPEPLPFAWRN